MANKDDYLTYYREFFENFAQSMNPNDQLPVKLASYKLVNVEVVGGIIDWATQYLTQKKCPQHLVAPLIKIVIDEIRKNCKKQPVSCGFNPKDNAYEPLKLMQTVMAKINEVCLRYLDNSMLCSLPSPGTPYFTTSSCAVKNTRRRMEDRHVVIHDLNTMFNIQEASPSSYYAIFDGHAGHDAAAYSSAHLHQFLAEDKHFIANPEQALVDAFCKTDTLFIDKCKVENLSSGTTALVALLRPKEKTLYVAWAGDSLALLANQGRILQIVDPHKPSRPDERERIEKQGGCVMLWGTWRVNGQLAVSRAIGDSEYKPYVTAIPEVREISLDGGEDFLILACDGLWDFVSEDSVARAVYRWVTENADDTDRISTSLVQLAKEQGSTDNISVIIIFLREPSKIAAEAHWANRNCPTNTMETGLDNANNPFAMPNGAPTDNILSQKTEGLLLNLSDNFKQNGTDNSPSTEFYHKEKTNGKRSASEFDDDDDFGPETDVDAVDDVVSPSAETVKSFDNAIFKDTGLEGHFNPFMEHQEKAALEIERSLQKKEREYCEDDDDEDFEEGSKEKGVFEASQFIAQKLEDKFDEDVEDKFKFDEQRMAREETPTPPADAVHDVGGLDNAAESDSEDEWNYIKGETADKENIDKENIPPQPEKEVADIPEEEDNMSQLNPNAAEFVPVSPTRSIPSPACRTLINDEVISQSPKRATQEIDINLPNPNDFASEVKSRPSEVDSFNGHSDANVSKPSDLMENLLNGKNIDEIPEFHPGSTPKKTAPSDEFHFGPNAAPFTPSKFLDQSEALSTKAVYGDESTATLGTTFNESTQESSSLNKESDPMNMSFYGDKSDNNPFDLNKVQVLPDNVEEFLNQSENSSFNEAFSDLPEHYPLGEPEKVNRTLNLNNDEAILITDLDKQSYDDEKELASPLEPERELMAEDESENIKTPEPTNENLLGDFVELEKPKTPQLDLEIPVEPIKEATEVADLLQGQPQNLPEDVELISSELSGNILVSPKPEENTQQAIEVQDLLQSSEPIEIPESIEPSSNEKLLSVSPVGEKLELLIPEASKSPVPEVEIKPADCHPIFASFSPAFNQPISPVPEEKAHTPDYTSPEIVEKAQEHFEELCQSKEVEFTSPDLIDKAREHFEDLCYPKENLESPQEEVTSSVKDDEIISPVDDQIIDESFVCDTRDLMADEVKNVVIETSKNAQHTDVESITTAEVNAFLERSLPPEVTSPILSPIDLPVKETQLLIHTQGEEIDIKTEKITPEFAEQAVVTPSEESKQEDLSGLEETFIKETIEEKKADEIKELLVPVETLAATTITAASVAAIGAAVAASPILKEEKKSSTAVSKKSSTKSMPTSKPAPKPMSARPLASARTAPSKPWAAKPLTTTPSPRSKPAPSPAAAPKPRTTLSTTPKSTEKKPVANGDIKASPRSTLFAKKEVGAIKATTSRLTTSSSLTSKTSATKPAEVKSTTSTRTITSTTRPITAPKTMSTTQRTVAAAAAAAPKRPATVPPKRPTTLTASKTINNTNSTTTTTKSTLTSTSPRTATAKPKVTTTTTTMTARARVPLTKTITKTADAEKQIKESANKITASRNVTSRPPTTTASKTSTTTVRKTDSKVSATRMTVSKTSTTTMKSATARKPAELVKNVSKTKTTKIEKPKENGVSTVVTEEITVVTTANSVIESEPQLLKDNSPLDNKLIVDTLIETNTAAD